MITSYTFTILALLCTFNQTFTERVAIAPTEATYLLDAPESIAAVVEALDKKINFKENYEVTVPTKAGIQINSWNSLIASAKNPGTKNLLFIINPDFFATCNKEEQEFLVTRAVISTQKGVTSWAFTYGSWIMLLIYFLIMVMCNRLLSRSVKNFTRMFQISSLLVLICTGNLTYTFISTKIMSYLKGKAVCELNKEAMEKSGVSKEIALSALGKLDAAIKNDLAQGNWFWKPYVTEFEDQIKKLEAQ